MVPRALVVLDALPMTSNGKINRDALPEPDETAYLRASYIAPVSDLEKNLVSLWQRNLNLDQVGVEDNYFSVGGDSIRSISLVSEAKREGIHFSVKDIFVHPTISRLAHTISGKEFTSEGLIEVEPFSLVSAEERLPIIDEYGVDSVEDIYPMSLLQQGMVFHYLQQQNLHIYHDVLFFNLAAEWDISAFGKSLDHMVGKHTILRTKFLLDKDRPLQLVLKPVEMEFAVADLRDVDESSKVESLQAWIKDEKNRGLAFASFPWRVGVFITGEAELVLGASVHLALLDCWRRASFLTESIEAHR